MSEETTTTRKKPERDEKGRLLPGQGSLNPGGRPEGSLSLITLLRQGLQEINKDDEDDKSTRAQTLVKNILEGAIIKKDKDMVKLIFGYLEGLPKSRVEHTGKDEGPVEISIVDYKPKNDEDPKG